MQKQSKLYILFLCIFCVVLSLKSDARCQSQVDLNSLRVPTAPGFTLLGVEPTSIERPGTPKALALQLLSSSMQSDFLPKNYALEVAPYWLTSHPKLTFNEYYNPGFIQTIAQTMAFSLATTSQDSSSTGTSLGFGTRFMLKTGHASTELDSLRKVLRIKLGKQDIVNSIKYIKAKNKNELITEINRILDDYIEKVKLNPERMNVPGLPNEAKLETLEDMKKYIIKFVKKHDANSSNEVKELVQKLINQGLDQDLRDISLEVRKANKKRLGLMIEVAGAFVTDFPDDTFENHDITRWGLWSTFTYRTKKPMVDFLAVLRFIQSEKHDDNFFDIGGRIVWEHERIALSAEALVRFGVDIDFDNTNKEITTGTFQLDNSSRINANIEYRLSEKQYLSFSFGKNFDSVTGQGDLISLLGLNTGFGDLVSLVNK